VTAATAEGPRHAAVAGIFAATALIGVILTPLAALGVVSLEAALLLPFAVPALALVLAMPHAGLCVAAFAIGPLGVVQHEIAGITVNLPEALVLALAAREAARALAGQGPDGNLFPRVTTGLFLVASAAGLATGMLRGNGAVRALQDFRQFTEYLLLLWVVVRQVREPREITQILACYAAGITLLAVHGILQRFTGMGIPADQLVSDLVYHKGIRSGSFYGATPLGGLMVLAAGPCLGQMLGGKSLAGRVLFGVCLALCLVAVVFTKTRASWIALAIALVFFFATIRLTPRVLALALCGAVVFTVFMGPLVAQRMATLRVTRTERSLLDRVKYYTAAWHIFRAHPVAGLGYGAHYDVGKIYVNKRYVPADPRGASGEATVHSAYLQVLVKTGLPGLAVLLLLLAQPMRAVWRAQRVRHADPRAHTAFTGLAAGVAGYLVHSAGENFFQWPVMSQSFWLLAGLVLVWSASLCQEERAPEAETAP
jgi:hypothetical protein